MGQNRARKLLERRRLQRDAREMHQPRREAMTQTVQTVQMVTSRKDAKLPKLPTHGNGGQRVVEVRVGARRRTVL